MFAQIWAKNGLFQHFLKIELETGWKQAKILDIMIGMYGTPSICLGKFFFGQILGNRPKAPDQSDCFIFKML